MIFQTKLALLCFLLGTLCNLVYAQRSLLHWKRDLEHRLRLYEDNRNQINQIIASSIISQTSSPASVIGAPGPTFVASNVHFKDLIVTDGSLQFEQPVAQASVNVMRNKTGGYIGSKMSEVYEITSDLGNINRHIDRERGRFIYKGSRRAPNQPVPLYHNGTRILGRRIFRQIGHIHAVRSPDIYLKRVNASDVDRVLAETYMENPKMRLEDSQGRLYFEGTKTFWNTVFLGQLRSGCCDRMKPLHTNRMMIRSQHQEVLAPILVRSAPNARNSSSVIIKKLSAQRISSRNFMATPRPGDLSMSPITSSITPHDIIKLYDPIDRPEIQKTVVFEGGITVGRATLQSHDNKLVIHIAGPNQANTTVFSLDHSKYLLRHPSSSPQISVPNVQRIEGSVILEGNVAFVSSITPVDSVNSVADFRGLLTNNIVRIDRPSVISGPIRLGQTSNGYNNPYGPKLPPGTMLPSNEILRVAGQLNVKGVINGMRWPHDLIVLPLHPQQVLYIRGRRSLTGNVKFNSHLTVRGRVAGMKIPEEVIPLHSDDPYYDYGQNATALFFQDGIDVSSLQIVSGQFDEINLKDVQGNEQDLIMKSMLATKADRTKIIRAPLRVQNLHLFGSKMNEGLLNGIRPQDILELKMSPQDQYYRELTIYGKKTFLNEVEVADCKFDNINDIYNWTNQLIRIDRPLAQTVYSRLAFVHPPTSLNDSYQKNLHQPTSTVRVDNLRVEYEMENGNQASYARNWNFSPELYIINQALARTAANYTRDRYRVAQQVRLLPRSNQQRPSRINGVELGDIITLDQPFKFNDRYVMVGKVDVRGTIQANRIRSNYPLDNLDLIQFAKYRVPLFGNKPARFGPIKLNNVVLAGENRALHLQSQLINGLVFNEFVNSTMSLTRPQVIDSRLVFKAPTNFEAIVRTHSSLNGIKHFRDFAARLQQAKYVFEDGLQCNAVMIAGAATG